jgi:hypothetical protein
MVTPAASSHTLCSASALGHLHTKGHEGQENSRLLQNGTPNTGKWRLECGVHLSMLHQLTKLPGTLGVQNTSPQAYPSSRASPNSMTLFSSDMGPTGGLDGMGCQPRTRRRTCVCHDDLCLEPTRALQNEMSENNRFAWSLLLHRMVSTGTSSRRSDKRPHQGDFVCNIYTHTTARHQFPNAELVELDSPRPLPSAP